MIVIIEITIFLLKSLKCWGRNICIREKKISQASIRISGEIAVIPTFKIGIEGANNLKEDSEANQSNETTDSEDELALDNGANKSSRKFGYFIL